MEIQTVDQFTKYFLRVRERTQAIIDCIPPDRITWTYKAGKFTLGDLVRHIATTERFMFAENAAGRPSTYPGCGPDLAQGYEPTMALFAKLHVEAMEIFNGLGDKRLKEKCVTPGGFEITVWKWLRAMIEHEIHHRGQIYIYLALLHISGPPLHGLTSEEVLERSEPLEM